MLRIEWSPTFETGMREIDDDHRHLFAIVDDIRDSAAEGEIAETGAKVGKFIGLAERHFAREEQILVEVGFPDIDFHKHYHASLLAQARVLEHVCRAEFDPDRMHACYEELVAFLVDDVVRGDSQFKSYLEHHGFTGKRRTVRSGRRIRN